MLKKLTNGTKKNIADRLASYPYVCTMSCSLRCDNNPDLGYSQLVFLASVA